MSEQLDVLHHKTPEDKRRASLNRIENDFTYHPPTGAIQVNKYNSIREAGKQLAIMLANVCPESRELSIALTNLEQVMFWANASIARNT